MDIRLLYSLARSARYRFLATGSLVVFMATTVMRVDAQHWCHLAMYRRPRILLRQRSLLGDDSQIAR